MFRLLALAALCLGVGSGRAADLPFLIGGDVSLLTRIEQGGGVYKDAGKPAGALEIFRAHGANAMRLRLWVKPSGAAEFVNDLPYTLALAKRIKQQGFRLILDLHYSDTWADPGHQSKPAAWKDLPFDQLVRQTESYSRETLAVFRTAGVLPDMVQVGNEITNGMLWPDGKPGELGGWKKLGELLRAGVRGVRAGAAPGAAPLIMIHLHNGFEPGLWRWFFENLKKQGGGVDFDVLGLSYYPADQPWPRLAQLKQSLADAARELGKPIIIVETALPPAGKADEKSEFNRTPEGQKQFLQALIATVRETPGGLGRGVIWWEPEWLPVAEMPHYGGQTLLFGNDGEALPAIGALTPNPPK